MVNSTDPEDKTFRVHSYLFILWMRGATRITITHSKTRTAMRWAAIFILNSTSTQYYSNGQCTHTAVQRYTHVLIFGAL